MRFLQVSSGDSVAVSVALAFALTVALTSPWEKENALHRIWNKAMTVVGSLSKHDFDGSENAIWTRNFASLQSFFNYSKSLCLKKCVLTILELNWNQRLGHKKTKLNICHHMLTSSTQLQNWSFTIFAIGLLLRKYIFAPCKFGFNPFFRPVRLPWECHDQSQETNWRYCVTGPELPYFTRGMVH